MANDVEIITPRREHLAQVEAWSSHNTAVKTLFKQPGSAPAAAPNTHSWVALSNGEVLAIATVELNKEHVGYLNCVVKPASQRQGVGSQMIEYVLSQPSVADLMHLHAVVDPGNTAARKILNRNGFSRVGYGPDGRIEFARHKHL